ncbi:Gfo/Idh/MocA family oxidoreductase [Lachnospiraceae bacterium MD308]|nr:Gfo/Idh/MocA family oxidoreductase [Lachnospiraceae bacterium MD308]
MKTLKIGVIGTGHMGRNHVRNFSEEKRFDFVGLYDSNTEMAKFLAEKYDVKAFESIDGLLENVEAVTIAVPSSKHKEIALAAAEHGVHALVEKPLATTSEDAEEITNVFRKRNLKLTVGHIERFNPVFRELQKLVKDEEIFFIETNRYSPFSNSGHITDTSVVEDLMIHDVDLVCALMTEGGGKKLTSIHGRGETIRSGQTDFATCLMDFGGQAHAVVNVSRISQNKERLITVHTANSCICADLLAKTLNIYKSTNLTVDLSRDNSYVQDGLVQRVYVPIEEPLRAELIAFYESVVNGAPIKTDGAAGINAIKICEEVANRAKMQRL